MEALRIFVSHSHHDDAFARDLVDALRTAGADVWYDLHNLDTGRLIDVIDRELRSRPIFIVILSPAALASEWVKEESSWAYLGVRRDSTRIILPVLAASIDEDAIWLTLQLFRRIAAPDGAPLPPAQAIRNTLRALNLPMPSDAYISGPPKPDAYVLRHSQSPAGVHTLLQRATDLFTQHRYREAVSLVDQAVQLAPNSFEAWTCKAQVCNELKEGQPALAAANRALQLNSHSATAWASQASALNLLKHPREALVAANRALVFDPKSVGAWNSKAAAFFGLKRYDDALEAYEYTITLDPSYANAWVGKGNVYGDYYNHPAALAIFEHAISLDASCADAWAGKANTLYRLKRYTEALDAYEHAILLNPSAAVLWYGKSYSLSALGRHIEAKTAMRRAEELDT